MKKVILFAVLLSGVSFSSRAYDMPKKRETFSRAIAEKATVPSENKPKILKP